MGERLRWAKVETTSNKQYDQFVDSLVISWLVSINQWFIMVNSRGKIPNTYLFISLIAGDNCFQPGLLASEIRQDSSPLQLRWKEPCWQL